MKSAIVNRRNFCLGAGGALLAPASGSAQNAERKVSMGSAMPTLHPASTFVASAVEAIQKETNGEMRINFFANSMLGSEPAMFSQLRSGAIDFATLSCSFLQSVVPVAGLPGIAFAFADYNAVWSALDGDLGENIRAALSKVGLVAFKIVDNGFRHTTTSGRPINAVDDLAGLKIRVPPSALLTSLFASLGAGPTTIPLGELYSALQTKVVDGMENSLVNLDALKVYEVQKYCAKTAHSWDGLWLLARAKSWNELPNEIKSVVKRNFDDAAVQQQKEFMRLDQQMQKDLEAKGMTFTSPDRNAFREKLQKVGYYRDWKAKFDPDAWTKLEKHTGPLS